MEALFGLGVLALFVLLVIVSAGPSSDSPLDRLPPELMTYYHR